VFGGDPAGVHWLLVHLTVEHTLIGCGDLAAARGKFCDVSDIHQLFYSMPTGKQSVLLKIYVLTPNHSPPTAFF
jgi:hypothetical protein